MSMKITVDNAQEDYKWLIDNYEYDGEGSFVWKDEIPNKYFKSKRAKAILKGRRFGKPIGRNNDRSFINGRQKKLADIVWLYHYKEWPSEKLYPRDKDRTNTRLDNLCFYNELDCVELTRESLTQCALRELFNYNPETGQLIYLPRSQKYFKTYPEMQAWNKINACNNAARPSERESGYICLTTSLGGLSYITARLIFFYMEGYWPEVVDHYDRDPTNNRWNNLRAATHAINCKNASPNSRNTTGYSGLWFDPEVQKWRGSFQSDYKTIHVGYHEDKEEMARQVALKRLEYGFTPHHGISVKGIEDED